MKDIISKTCSLCGDEKKISDFYKDTKSKTGYRKDCKSCCNKRSSEYFKENKSFVKELHKNYYENNKVSIIERVADWYKSNKDRHKEYGKVYVLRHPEKSKESSRKRVKKWTLSHPEYKKTWVGRNPHKGRQYNQNRRARVLENGGEITAEEWKSLLDFYGHKCLCCGKTEDEVEIHLDHVVPVSRGGKNVITNAQPLCKSCNSKKHTMIIDYRVSA